jgi:hypothetical protein
MQGEGSGEAVQLLSTTRQQQRLNTQLAKAEANCLAPQIQK